MSDEMGKTQTNGVAIVASVVIAGIVGTLASALFGRGESKQQVARKHAAARLERLETSASQTLDQLNKAVESLNIPHPGNSKRARRKARSVGKSASKAADATLKSTRSLIADIDRESLRLQAIEKANKLGHDGSERASELAQLLSSRTSDFVQDNRAGVDEWRAKASRSVSDALERGSTLAHQAKDEAPGMKQVAMMAAHAAVARGSKAAHGVQDRTPGLIDKATHLLHDAADQGAGLASKARDKSPELRDMASKSAHDLADHARELAPDVRDKAAELTSTAVDRASSLVDQAKDRTPELIGAVGTQVSHAVHAAQSQARPVVEEATSAASRAVEQVKDAGKRASETILPEMHHRADDVAAKVSAQRQSAMSSMSSFGAAATGKIGHTTEAIEHKSKSAATAAGRGTKDAGALLAWSAVAAGLAYITFLDEQQRQKLKESGKRIAVEIKAVYRDIRGDDQEFG